MISGAFSLCARFWSLGQPLNLGQAHVLAIVVRDLAGSNLGVKTVQREAGLFRGYLGFHAGDKRDLNERLVAFAP